MTDRPATRTTRRTTPRSVRSADELARRPGRPIDPAAELAAAGRVTAALVHAPETVFDALAQAALEVCRADAAGISLLETRDDREVFRWMPLAGSYAGAPVAEIPRHEMPCDHVIGRDEAVLVVRPGSDFPAVAGLDPPVHEALLVPLRVDGRPVATVWIVGHDPVRAFDAEDARLLGQLARFAAVAWRLNGTTRSLHDAEAHARNLIELSPQFPWTADADGRILDISARWLGLTGLTREQGLGDGWVRAQHPDDRAAMQTAWVRSVTTGEPYDVEHRLRTSDGPFRWMRSSARRFRGGDGTILRWYGTTEDIDDRKRAELVLLEENEWLAHEAVELQRLRDAQRTARHRLERLHAMTAALAQAIRLPEVADAVVDGAVSVVGAAGGALSLLDDDGSTFTRVAGPGVRADVASSGSRYANEPQLPAGEAVRTRRPCYLRTRAEYVARDPRLEATAAALGLEALASLPLVLGDRVLGEIGLYFRSPQAFDEDQDLLLRTIAAQAAQAIERALQREREQRRTDTFVHLVKDNPFGIYLVDADFRLAEVSRGAQKVFENVRPLLGRDFAEVIRLLWPEPAATGFIETFRRTLATGEPYRAPRTVEVRADVGETEAYDWRIERIVLPDGHHGVVCYFYELTEQQRLEARLLESERALRRAQAVGRIGSLVVDVATGRAVYSPEYLALHGLPPDAPGESREEWLARVHPQDRERAARDLDDVLVGGADVYESEFRVVWPSDGTVHWIKGRGEVERDDGRTARLVVTQYETTAQRTAEESARRSEATLKLLADTMPQMVWATRPDGFHDYYNARWYEFTGVPEGSTDGEAWNGMFHPDDQARAWERWHRSLATGEPYEVEYRLRRHDGVYRWVLGRALPLRDGRGRIVRWFGTCTDVDDVRQALDAQQRAAELLSAATDAAELGVHEYDAGTGAFRWDARVRRLWGVPDDLPIDVAVFESAVHPDDLDAVRACVSRALDPAGDGRYAAEYRVTSRADGVERWVQATGRVSVAHGRALRLIGTVRDVTEARRASAALRESESRFRMLADGAPVLIWVNGLDGCEFVNAHYLEFTGLPMEQIVGHGWTKVLHPEDADALVAAYDAALRSGAPFEANLRLRRHDGAWRWTTSYGRARRDAAGAIVGYVGCTIDVTELYEARLALEEADRHKDRFIATLSHELRNPLAPIRIAARILESPRLSATQLEQARGIIGRQVAHMGHLLDDLLDLARITQGKLELRRTITGVKATIDAALEAVRPVIDARRQRLTCVLLAIDPVLLADPVRLSQIVSNLLTNAAKYTDEGGHVELVVALEGRHVRIEVRDDGIGISPSELPELFTMFSQVEGTQGRSEGGLGIGLALVKALAELHGGTVSAASEGPGRGSTFTVRLPLAEVDRG